EQETGRALSEPGRARERALPFRRRASGTLGGHRVPCARHAPPVTGEQRAALVDGRRVGPTSADQSPAGQPTTAQPPTAGLWSARDVRSANGAITRGPRAPASGCAELPAAGLRATGLRAV